MKKKNVVIGTIGAAAAASATYLAAGRIAIEKVCTRRKEEKVGLKHPMSEDDKQWLDHQTFIDMEIKKRNPNKAVTLMLSKKDDVKKYGLVDEGTQRVIDKFMPGRMTIVLKRLDSVDSRHVSGKDTIGIRIPDSSFVLSLIDQTGPLSVTSANLSGQGNTTNEKEVLAQLDGQIDMVVRGQTASATASTVVDLSQGDVRILREGLITKEEIEEVYYENCSRL